MLSGKFPFAMLTLLAVGAGSLSRVSDLHAQSAPCLISAVLECPSLTDRIQKTRMTFTRDSAAYTTDGGEVGQGEPRFQKMAIFNRPEYTVIGPCSKESIIPLAYCNGNFFGGQPWTNISSGNCLYRSIDANSWEPIAELEAGTIKSVYITQAGLVLVGTRKPGAVWVWEGDKQTLSRVLTMLSYDAYAKHWSWAEMNGVIYVGEYGNKNVADNARRIYQSLDGGWNWELLYDPPPQPSYHVHKVLADPYRSHIYWSHGDKTAGSQLFRSNDGGQTWRLLSNVEQPTAGIVRPEGTYLGSDSGGVGIYRFLDGSESGEFVCSDIVSSYVWDMREFNGVVYATSVNHQLWGAPTVVVSRDGEHWGNLYQWPAGISGLERFAGVVDGRVYGVMEEEMGNAATMFFPEPTVRTSWGVRVEPGTLNLLANHCDSSFESCDVMSWRGYGDSKITVTSEMAHSGNRSLRVHNPHGESTLGAISPVVNGNWASGTEICATVQVSGWGNGQVYLQISDKSNGLASHRVGTRPGVGWSELSVNWRLPGNSTSLCLIVVTWSAESALHIDSAALMEGQPPGSFHIGGEPRAAESLSHSVSFPDCWTDVFCWQAPYGAHTWRDESKVIKSWSDEDDNCCLQLVLDEDDNFQLQECKEDTIELLASVVAPDFLRGSLIRFAIVDASNEISLHVLSPQGWFRASGRRTGVNPTRMFFGSTPDGRMQAGGLYSNCRVYDASMNEDQIDQVIDEIAEQGWVVGDMNGDGDVGISDLYRLAERWLETECRESRWCESADIDMSGAVDLMDFSNLGKSWSDEP